MIDFREELSNPSTQCFILDSGSKSNHDDVDFEQYNWDTSRNGKPRKGDLFIYRRTTTGSEFNHQFYLFGAGRLGEIVPVAPDSKEVISKIEDPYVFSKNLFKDDLDQITLSFRNNPDNWMHSFDQYGMTRLSNKEDFLKIIELQDPNYLKSVQVNDPSESLTVKLYQDVQRGNYLVPDKIGQVKTRGAAQQLFAEKIKSFYNYRCAITGISTREFLVASHIIPWAKHEEHRLDPQNGICLSSLFDKAFDQGFISFKDDGSMMVSSDVLLDENLWDYIKIYQNKKIRMNKEYSPNVEFLKYHRENIFRT
jgi:putative restriction endonuclease